MGAIWRVDMLGTLQAGAEDVAITRFRTRRVGLLLAYLAYYSERSHSRDELADMLWPEYEPEVARQNLRQALSSLRRHLEPPTVPSGAILVAKQARVSLNAELVTTDVAEFNALIKAANSASNAQKIEKLKRAVEVYRGDLLPGYYEDWVQRERLQLEDLLVAALQSLIQACEAKGQVEEAIRYVRMALAKDHLKEDMHATLMRLYLASGRPASALQHFKDWKVLLAAELHETPGEEIQALATRAEKGGTQKDTRKDAPAGEGTADEKPPQESQVARLPVQLTRFFGRTADRQRAVEEIAGHSSRLVTLFGPAGTGKTRLSIEIGRRLADEHGWNVWFVPLADLDQGIQVPRAIVEAMRLNSQAGNTAVDVLQANLSGTNNLLILDNLEHILEGTAPVVEDLLGQVPGVSILATSRQCLKIGGEKEIDLTALPIPDDEVSAPQDLAEYPSVQLFVDRAQAVLPDFQLTAHNAPAIAAIAKKLDGLPLALEIAAGLSNAFSPQQMLQNLENRLEILRSRRRDLSGRHRSLRAAIDYSYDLLTPEQQAFFVALSVFRGGFTIEAANRVCLPNPETTKEGLRMVLDLQERSLLRSEDAGEGCPARFRLLESFREYGAEQLDAGQEFELKQRHANFYFELGRDRNAGVDHEQDNRLTALRFFFEQEESHACVKLLEALHGNSPVGHDTIRALVRSPKFDGFDPIDKIMLLRLLADAHLYPSEFDESLRVSLQALDIAKEIEREDQIAICHRGIAVAAGYLGHRKEAIDHTQRFLTYAEKTGNLRMIEHGYNALGAEYWCDADFESASKAFDGALAASTRLHGSELPWDMLYNLARVRLDTGQLDDGMQYAAEGVRLAQARGDEYGVSMCLGLMALYYRLKGNQVAALATNHEALIKRRKVGFLFWTLQVIQGHASILVEMGKYRDAAVLLAASRSVTKLNRAVEVNEHRESVEKTKAHLTEAEFEQAWAEGLAMNMEDAFRLAARYR